jgi:antitoxin PrlF
MAILEEVSTITAKGQTTVPKAVRKVLGVGAGDKIAFLVDGQQVTVVAAEAPVHEDPLLGEFLRFIARDIERRPEGVKALSSSFAARLASMTRGNKVDPDAPIDGDVDL